MDTFSDSRVTSDTYLPWGRGGLNSDVPKMFRSVSLTKKVRKLYKKEMIGGGILGKMKLKHTYVSTQIVTVP